MKIERQFSDEAVLAELGRRIAQHRLDLQFTQAQVAQEAGVSKRTLERIEAGDSTQMSSIIRVLRMLDIMEGLDGLVAESGPRPVDQLKLKKKERRRASSKRSQSKDKPWRWNDEA